MLSFFQVLQLEIETDGQALVHTVQSENAKCDFKELNLLIREFCVVTNIKNLQVAIHESRE